MVKLSLYTDDINNNYPDIWFTVNDISVLVRQKRNIVKILKLSLSHISQKKKLLIHAYPNYEKKTSDH